MSVAKVSMILHQATLLFLNPKSVKLMASLYLNFLTSMKRISKLPGHKSKNTICRGMHILVKGFLLAYFFFSKVFWQCCAPFYILLLNPKQRFKLNVLIQYKMMFAFCCILYLSLHVQCPWIRNWKKGYWSELEKKEITILL